MSESDSSRWLAHLPLRVFFAGIAILGGVTACATVVYLYVRSATLASGGICDESYSGVQNTKCLWVAAGESVGLQWSINACVETQDGPVQNITSLNGEIRQCTSRPMRAAAGLACALNTCYKGTYLADDQGIVTNDPDEDIGRFFKCTAPVDDECLTMTRSCQSVQRACVPANTNYNPNTNYHYPYCSLGCKQQIDQDQTLMLDVSSDYLSVPPVVLSPQKFLAVSNTRRVVRTATYAPPPESDLIAGQLVWRYQVPRVADVLEENFSPNLFISRVRAFTRPDPDSLARNYLVLAGVKVDLGSGVNCAAANADATMVTSDNCPTLAVTTPTYVQSASSLSAPALVWKIKLLDGAHGGNAGLSSNSPVFIEFTLANLTASGSAPFLRNDYNFGVLPSGAQRTDPGALKLDLQDSTLRWVVDSVSTSGSDAQDFSLEVEGPSGHVGAGGIRNINVTFHPSSDGVKAAWGNVSLTDPLGNRRTVSAHLQAESGAQSLGVSPGMLNFSNATFSPQPLPWRKNLLLENFGSAPIIVQDVTIGGPDADSFSVSRGENPESPVAPAFAIASGDSELLHVSFCPARYGNFSAQISITGNEGTPTNPILAVKTGLLQGTAYAPTQLCLAPTNFPFAPGHH